MRLKADFLLPSGGYQQPMLLDSPGSCNQQRPQCCILHCRTETRSRLQYGGPPNAPQLAILLGTANTILIYDGFVVLQQSTLNPPYVLTKSHLLLSLGWTFIFSSDARQHLHSASPTITSRVTYTFLKCPH